MTLPELRRYTRFCDVVYPKIRYLLTNHLTNPRSQISKNKNYLKHSLNIHSSPCEGIIHWRIKTENITYLIVMVKSSYYSVSKKNASEGDVWFFNPKNVTIDSVVDQNKKSPSFWPIGQKILILHENLEFLMPGENLPLKKVNFWPRDQKDGNFLFWSTPEPIVTFLGLKNHTSP